MIPPISIDGYKCYIATVAEKDGLKNLVNEAYTKEITRLETAI